MLRRIIVTAVLGGALILAPSAAHADKRGDDNKKEASQSDNHGRDNRQGDNDGHRSDHNDRQAHERHESGHVDRGDHDRRSYHDHDGRYDDYYRYYGYDDGYYGYYGYRCNGYRDGYYYDRYGRPIYGPDGRPYHRRNADCDNYYSRYHRYYGEPYCDRYDAATGYCD